MNNQDIKNISLEFWNNFQKLHQLLFNFRLETDKSLEKIADYLTFSQKTCYSLNHNLGKNLNDKEEDL